MTTEPYAIGIDLGGTKIEVARVTVSGMLLAKSRVATPEGKAPEAVRETIIEAVQGLADEGDAAPVGLGIGVAGQIDPGGAAVRFAPNLDWHDVPLQSELKEALDLSVVLLNDVRAAAWGEWLYGVGRGCADLVCLFVGTGIGGGVVSGGRMLTGSSNTAGELGHITLDLHGPSCHCGNRGCLEALAGGWAIARAAEDATTADPSAGAALVDLVAAQGGTFTAELVGVAAAAGDPLALRVLAAADAALVAGTIGLVNAFNPARLILGGGIVEGRPALIKAVAEGVRERALHAAVAGLEVVPAALHNDAGVIGAAACALRRFGEEGNLR